MSVPEVKRQAIGGRHRLAAARGLTVVRPAAGGPDARERDPAPGGTPAAHARVANGDSRERTAAITRHRRALGAVLGRDVGDSVATLDYLVNVSGDLDAPAVVEGEVLDILDRQSAADPLTGLPNRSAFDAALKREVARSLQYHAPLSLLVLDLDHFKSVNDRWGHFAGDLVLSCVSRAIQDGLRGSDVAFRFGGDVFAVLLPSTRLAAARQVAARVVAEVRSCVAAGPVPDLAAAVSASAGVAELSGAAAMPRVQLVTAAHLAMVAAKERGGNCVSEGVPR